jgi:hypothetical protein
MGSKRMRPHNESRSLLAFRSGLLASSEACRNLCCRMLLSGVTGRVSCLCALRVRAAPLRLLAPLRPPINRSGRTPVIFSCPPRFTGSSWQERRQVRWTEEMTMSIVDNGAETARFPLCMQSSSSLGLCSKRVVTGMKNVNSSPKVGCVPFLKVFLTEKVCSKPCSKSTERVRIC